MKLCIFHVLQLSYTPEEIGEVYKLTFKCLVLAWNLLKAMGWFLNLSLHSLIH